MSKDPLREKTLKFTFEDGQMKGKTISHAFGSDGTVKFGGGKDAYAYKAATLNDSVVVMSYQTANATLTVVLDFEKGTLVSIASGEKIHELAKGTFEEVDAASTPAKAHPMHPVG